MNVELDTAAKALYLRLTFGRVAETAELEELVVADYDETGRMLGVEFVRAQHFGPFLLEHPEVAILPSRLPYADIDRGRSWEIETGADARPVVERTPLNAELNGAFVDEVLAIPSLVDRVPDGTTIIPLRAGAAHLSTDEALALGRKLADEGKTPVLQPLGFPSPEPPEWETIRAGLEGADLRTTTPIELTQVLAELGFLSWEGDERALDGKDKAIVRTA